MNVNEYREFVKAKIKMAELNRAILLGRNGGASELCESYFDDGVKYLRMAEADRNVPSLFDELDKESRAV